MYSMSSNRRLEKELHFLKIELNSLYEELKQKKIHGFDYESQAELYTLKKARWEALNVFSRIQGAVTRKELNQRLHNPGHGENPNFTKTTKLRAKPRKVLSAKSNKEHTGIPSRVINVKKSQAHIEWPSQKCNAKTSIVSIAKSTAVQTGMPSTISSHSSSQVYTAKASKATTAKLNKICIANSSKVATTKSSDFHTNPCQTHPAKTSQVNTAKPCEVYTSITRPSLRMERMELSSVNCDTFGKSKGTQIRSKRKINGIDDSCAKRTRINFDRWNEIEIGKETGSTTHCDNRRPFSSYLHVAKQTFMSDPHEVFQQVPKFEQGEKKCQFYKFDPYGANSDAVSTFEPSNDHIEQILDKLHPSTQKISGTIDISGNHKKADDFNTLFGINKTVNEDRTQEIDDNEVISNATDRFNIDIENTLKMLHSIEETNLCVHSIDQIPEIVTTNERNGNISLQCDKAEKPSAVDLGTIYDSKDQKNKDQFNYEQIENVLNIIYPPELLQKTMDSTATGENNEEIKVISHEPDRILTLLDKQTFETINEDDYSRKDNEAIMVKWIGNTFNNKRIEHILDILHPPNNLEEIKDCIDQEIETREVLEPNNELEYALKLLNSPEGNDCTDQETEIRKNINENNDRDSIISTEEKQPNIEIECGLKLLYSPDILQETNNYKNQIINEFMTSNLSTNNEIVFSNGAEISEAEIEYYYDCIDQEKNNESVDTNNSIKLKPNFVMSTLNSCVIS